MTSFPKDKYRTIAVDSYRPYDSALMMPASNALCVREAMAVGSIDTATHLHLVDREKKVVNSAKRTIEKLHKGAHINALPSELTEVTSSDINHEGLDYAFLDLCSSLNEDVIEWMDSGNFSSLFSESGATICFTVCTQVRTKTYINKLSSIISKHVDINAYVNRVMTSSNNWTSKVFFDGMHKGSAYTTKMTTACTLMALLTHHFKSAKLDECHVYKNDIKSYQMMLLKFDVGAPISNTSLLKRVSRGLGYTDSSLKKEKKVTVSKRPEGMSKQKWAWHRDNPKGMFRRRKKF